jgi:nucleotide-binding universal stress UspA family protein
MKKILVPTDFSESAGKALDFAINLSKIFDSKVFLVNTYAVPHAGATMMVSIDDLLKQESVKHLNKEEERLKAAHPNLEVVTYCLPGSLDAALKDFTKDHHIDLVVMGTTGASGWQGKLFGSNTANLVGNISCPVIAIPYESTVNKPCKLVISTDLKTPTNSAVYEPVKGLAASLGSSIRFVHITNKNTSKDLGALEKEFGNEVDFVYDEDVELGLNEYLSINNVDLLVIVAKKHGFFESLFNPSVSKRLARELTIPMMFLHE